MRARPPVTRSRPRATPAAASALAARALTRDLGAAPAVAAGTTQARRAYLQIRSDVMACRLMPGERLNIARIAEQLGVSLGAVREALSTLQAESLVVAEAQKGFTVSRVSRAELLDITHARVELEKLCLASSIESGDFEWEGEVLAAQHRLDRIEQMLAPGAPTTDAEWIRAHAHFHSTLVRACSSAWLLRMRWTLFEQSERYRSLAVPLAAPERHLGDEHRAIVQAVLAKDVARATQQVADHVWTTAQALLDAPALSA